MKRSIILLILLILTVAIAANAQGIIGSIFNQNGTQDEYMIQQIAALQLYKSYLMKGYKIVKDGSSTISGFKNGSLLQHTAHFDSLKTVSGRIRNYSRIQDIIDMDKAMLESYPQVYPKLSAADALTAMQLSGYRQLYNSLTAKASTDMDELQLVITSGKVQMTDDQRISKIDQLYYNMQRLQASVVRLNSQSLALAAQRQREAKDRAAMRSLYGQQAVH